MVTIDLKRMDKLEIDAKNMYAVVESYVTYAQLQSEAARFGLYTNAPLCGSQVSVLANHAGQGFGQLGQRAGLANRKVLGVEWVLPNGEILKLGSATNDPSGYFWGEGPGPDLRGLLRGWFGHFGGLGVITKMAVKLIPMPYEGVPEPWGITPSTGYDYPEESYRFYNVLYPSMEN
jgi:FAD/FMN-containing dehydrogenase